MIPLNMASQKKIAIIGGGASGFFGGLRCAEVARESSVDAEICLFESSSQFLRKVKISGGGRCNVTHHIYEPKEFCENYPRGKRELLSPFQQFQASDTVRWFQKRGVDLKYEADGRMFPTTDQSDTVIQCFLDEAKKVDLKLLPKKNVKSLKRLDSGQLSLHINEDESYVADSVLLATGSMPGGYRLAKSLGHGITDLAPSLFTFKIQDSLIEGLSGVSFPQAKLVLKIKGAKKYRQKGPLLITHWGLSGPALLKLSAWAARDMKKAGYSATLMVNWLGFESQQECDYRLQATQGLYGKAFLANGAPKGVVKRFWHHVLDKASIPREKPWNQVSKKEIFALSELLYSSALSVTGKSRFKEEFVECGGVDLREIHFKTMESKICPGLYFAGELMDVDGVTGGFNFQSAWTSGWIAGSHMLSEAAPL